MKDKEREARVKEIELSSIDICGVEYKDLKAELLKSLTNDPYIKKDYLLRNINKRS